VQECAVGLVRVRRVDGRLAFEAPPPIREGPVEEELIERIAVVLGIERGAIEDAQWVDNGPGWVAVLLRDANAVLSLEPAVSDLDLAAVGFYPQGAPAAFEVRAWFPAPGGLIEDPVTGSLNASLAQWLLASGRLTAPYLASQGAAIGRAGHVHVSQEADGSIWVGGETVTAISGSVEL
jgi:PhzF family phenazine biosynthesis protein